jgi:hypothetical protein
LMKLAGLSDPKINIDTSGLSPQATETANQLAKKIAKLSDDDLQNIKRIIDEA